MPSTLNVACLASGGGTTIEAILHAINTGRLPGVCVRLVISSNAKASVMYRAQANGMHSSDILVIDPREYRTPEVFGRAILDACEMRKVGFIGQYGWLPKTPVNVVQEFRTRIVNQHPGSLAPSHSVGEHRYDFGGKGMYGRRVIAAARHFAHKTDTRWYVHATSHYVDADLDTGPVIRQWQVPFTRDDSVEAIQTRLLPVEHAVQIATLGDAANNLLGRGIVPEDPVPRLHLYDLLSARERGIQEYPSG